MRNGKSCSKLRSFESYKPSPRPSIEEIDLKATGRHWYFEDAPKPIICLMGLCNRPKISPFLIRNLGRTWSSSVDGHGAVFTWTDKLASDGIVSKWTEQGPELTEGYNLLSSCLSSFISCPHTHFWTLPLFPSSNHFFACAIHRKPSSIIMERKTYAKRIGGSVENAVISVTSHWKAVALLAYSSGVVIAIGIYMNSGQSSFLQIQIDHFNIFQSLITFSQSNADGVVTAKTLKAASATAKSAWRCSFLSFWETSESTSFMPITGSWLSSSCSLLAVWVSGCLWM